jgi:electron transfer flavoprotein alpha subunit
MHILVIAEHNGATLRPVTANAVAAACQLKEKLQQTISGSQIHVLVAGRGAPECAAQAATIQGVDHVWVSQAPHLEDQLAEAMTSQILAACHSIKCRAIIFPSTAFGKNIAPRVAALLDVAQLSDVIAIHADNIFQRPIYAGNVIATVKTTDPICVLTVQGTAFEALGEQPPAFIETMPAATPPERMAVFQSREIPQLMRPELTAARVVVAGGRALGSAENFGLLENLADCLGAAMGASRAAVDAGYAPNDWQVGQTGKIVAPQLYIAVGISGAIQHLAGMKGARVIVAINQDPEAPIFSVADYGVVGDLFDLVPQLTQALRTP